jgi:uncharacterized membrane protein YeaQ/YmgE (transglycosylase-associated protein family)
VRGILAWIGIGLIAGAIARLVVRGHRRIGCIGTVLVGVAGSIVGGLAGDLIQPGEQVFEPAGMIGSILGAILVLIVLTALARRPFGR